MAARLLITLVAATLLPGAVESAESSALSTWQLAHIIAGEAGRVDCPLEGRLAVAHVAQRNARWNGWSTPDDLDWYAARNWHNHADPTRGSEYLFSDSDLRLAAVQKIVGNRATGRIACGDLGLNYVPEYNLPAISQEEAPRVRAVGRCFRCLPQ